MDINTGQSSSNAGSGGLFGSPAPNQPEKKAPKKKSVKSSKAVVFFIAIVVLLGLAGASYYFYNQNQESKQKYEQAQKEVERLSNSEQVAKEERDALVAKVSVLVELPKDETPTVATVTDVNKLKNQAFFADAQNGDKVLIYTKDKTAYLYRPSTNKIITIAPVNIGANKATTNTQNSTTNKTQ